MKNKKKNIKIIDRLVNLWSKPFFRLGGIIILIVSILFLISSIFFLFLIMGFEIISLKNFFLLIFSFFGLVAWILFFGYILWKGSQKAKKDGAFLEQCKKSWRDNFKKFSLKEQYKKSFDYLKKSRYFIYSIIVIFLVFALIGFFAPVPETFSKTILGYLNEIIKQTDGMGAFELMKFILFNNVQSSFYGMIFGVFLGVFSVFVSIFNGYILGFVASISVQSEGLLVLWRLFPHGIFELPAIFLSLGLGLKLGSFIFQKNKLESFKDFFLNSLRSFIFVVVPLLVIAGIIEGILIAFL